MDAEGIVVGRIMKAAAAPVEGAMMDAGLRPPRRSLADLRLRGDARSAMAAFAKSWRRE